MLAVVLGPWFLDAQIVSGCASKLVVETLKQPLSSWTFSACEINTIPLFEWIDGGMEDVSHDYCMLYLDILSLSLIEECPRYVCRNYGDALPLT